MAGKGTRALIVLVATALFAVFSTVPAAAFSFGGVSFANTEQTGEQDIDQEAEAESGDGFISIAANQQNAEQELEQNAETESDLKDGKKGDKDGKNGDGDNGDGDGDEENVTICHRPPGNPGNAQTIQVSPNAVPAHLAHGDSLGPCP